MQPALRAAISDAIASLPVDGLNTSFVVSADGESIKVTLSNYTPKVRTISVHNIPKWLINEEFSLSTIPNTSLAQENTFELYFKLHLLYKNALEKVKKNPSYKHILFIRNDKPGDLTAVCDKFATEVLKSNQGLQAILDAASIEKRVVIIEYGAAFKSQHNYNIDYSLLCKQPCNDASDLEMKNAAIGYMLRYAHKMHFDMEANAKMLNIMQDLIINYRTIVSAFEKLNNIDSSWKDTFYEKNFETTNIVLTLKDGAYCTAVLKPEQQKCFQQLVSMGVLKDTDFEKFSEAINDKNTGWNLLTKSKEQNSQGN